MNTKDLEKKEIDLLIEKGLSFKVQKRSILKYFGKRERVFEIRSPFLGTLDYLSAEYLNMDFSEANLNDPTNVFNEAKRLQSVNAKRCSRIIAIAVLNSNLGIKFFSSFLANYFLWHIDPAKLLKISELIISLSNISDFTNSIRLMSINPTTTAPSLIDTAKPQA